MPTNPRAYWLGFAASTLAGLSTFGFAQEITTSQTGDGTVTTTTTVSSSGTTAFTESQLLSGLLNDNVLLQDGQGIGRITDLVIGPAGNIEYLIGSSGGKMFPIPLSAIRETAGDQVKLTIDEAQFQQLPFFTNQSVPNFSSAAFQQEVFAVFGAGTTGTGATNVANAPEIQAAAANATQTNQAQGQNVSTMPQNAARANRDAAERANSPGVSNDELTRSQARRNGTANDQSLRRAGETFTDPTPGAGRGTNTPRSAAQRNMSVKNPAAGGASVRNPGGTIPSVPGGSNPNNPGVETFVGAPVGAPVGNTNRVTSGGNRVGNSTVPSGSIGISGARTGSANAAGGVTGGAGGTIGGATGGVIAPGSGVGAGTGANGAVGAGTGASGAAATGIGK